MPNMINRNAIPTLRKLAKGYPVVTITGLRQSGKTTLAKFVYKRKPIVSSEVPVKMELASEDPRWCLGQHTD